MFASLLQSLSCDNSGFCGVFSRLQLGIHTWELILCGGLLLQLVGFTGLDLAVAVRGFVGCPVGCSWLFHPPVTTAAGMAAAAGRVFCNAPLFLAAGRSLRAARSS